MKSSASPKTVTRTRVSLSSEGGNDIETAYLTSTKASKAKIDAAAKLMGLSVVETTTIPVGTQLYGGRYSRDNDFCFTHYTREEVAKFLDADAMEVLATTGSYTFDGDRTSACISGDGVAGEPVCK